MSLLKTVDKNDSKFLAALSSGKVSMDLQRARFLMEKVCLVAFINYLYGNEPSEETTKTCIEAKHAIPCSLCAKKMSSSLMFSTPSLPMGASLLFPFPNSLPRTTSTPKRKLSKKDREKLMKKLENYRETVWLTQRMKDCKQTRASFFPPHLMNAIVKQISSIMSQPDLNVILADQHWPFIEECSEGLMDLINSIRPKLTSKGNSKCQRKRVRETDEEFDMEAQEPNPPSLPPPPQSWKRQAFEDLSNVGKSVPHSKPKAPSKTLNKQNYAFPLLMAEMGPQCTN